MEIIKDYHSKELNKSMIDSLFYELNKELRRKFRKVDKTFKVDLYVVGGACIVTQLGTRESTCDIDAIWGIGADMREAINVVGDKFNLGHTWCNCDFKKTTSYTEAILYNSHVYMNMDRLTVWMVNYDLLLAMKLVAFRGHKPTDIQDSMNLVYFIRNNGYTINSEVAYSLIRKYFNLSRLSSEAKDFIDSLG